MTADEGLGEAQHEGAQGPVLTSNNSTRRAYERAALKALTQELTRRGRPTSVTGWPEDDAAPMDGLTVDALFEIAGRTWAAEHTRVTFGEKVEPHRQEAERELRAPRSADRAGEASWSPPGRAGRATARRQTSPPSLLRVSVRPGRGGTGGPIELCQLRRHLRSGATAT
jgi:hypothetical protein